MVLVTFLYSVNSKFALRTGSEGHQSWNEHMTVAAHSTVTKEDNNMFHSPNNNTSMHEQSTFVK